MLEVLTCDQMYKADAATIDGGTPGLALMETAGLSAAKQIAAHFDRCPVLVLCGPGNNGGDGFVVARHLDEAGWDVRLAAMIPPDKYKGDAATVAGQWNGETEALAGDTSLDDIGLIVDAVFGVGLARPIEGAVKTLFERINDARLPVAAIDIPSGVNGDSGIVDAVTPRARLTVTFCRKKPGHLLLPGRTYCGRTVVADIGITDETVAAQGTQVFENDPALWLADFPWPEPGGHKYDRGHALVLGGAEMTGAARLAASAALRIGAGLVTVTCPDDVFDIYASGRPDVIVRKIRDMAGFAALAEDKRITALLLGPGAGPSVELATTARKSLKKGKSCVLDADVFTAFEGQADELIQHLTPDCVLTPHDGEFRQFFGESDENRLVRAQNAAKTAGCIVLSKGADTVIAAPDGTAVINASAPPTLATAGAGDVLSGMIAGLKAQGMPAFQAACAAAWLHGDAARRFGLGLTASDIIENIPAVLNAFLPGGDNNM